MSSLLNSEDAERKSIIKQADILGIDPYATTHTSSRELKTKFECYGLCKDCSYFAYAASEFKVRAAFCQDFKIRLYDNDPVRECTAYECKTTATLDTMVDMATLIDAPKRKAGFIKEEEE